MKKMLSLATIALLISGFFLWSCKNDPVPELPERNPAMLKSGEINTEKICSPSYYSLVTKNNREVGQMTVSNDNNYLTVEFVGNGSISEIQLWVGTDPSMVPKNGQNIPVPGRFEYQGSGNAVFSISLYSLLPPPLPGGTFDGNTLYVFAHAEIQSTHRKGDDETSAWSEGTSFASSRWGSYSTYTTCCQPQGCFPYGALGGNNFTDGNYYYDNTENGGGSQDIHAENGEIAGTVKYASGILTFSFVGGWVFSGTQPSVTIEGFSGPGGSPASLFSGEPDSESGIYSLEIPPYPYYKIQYNLQKCN